MIIYYIIVISILLLGIPFYRIYTTKYKAFYLQIVFLLLFFIMSIRDTTVGTDIYIYHDKFLLIKSAKTFNEIISAVPNSPVYCLLNKLVSLVGNHRLFLVVVAAIILSSVAIYIYNFSDNVIFSTYCFVSLFFYLHTFNISRQFLAVAFTLFALCLRKNKKIISCIICWLLAIGIHSTALTAVPLLFLDIKKIKNSIFKKIVIGSFGAMILFKPLFPLLINWFCIIFPRYSVYLQGGKFSIYNRSSGSVIFLSIFYLCIAIFAIIVQSNIIKGVVLDENEKRHLRFFTIIVLLGAVVGISVGSYEAMARVLYFYQIHAICLIPNVIEKFRHSRYYILIYYIVTLVLLIPFTICLLKNFGEVVPYCMV